MYFYLFEVISSKRFGVVSLRGKLFSGKAISYFYLFARDDTRRKRDTIHKKDKGGTPLAHFTAQKKERVVFFFVSSNRTERDTKFVLFFFLVLLFVQSTTTFLILVSFFLILKVFF